MKASELFNIVDRDLPIWIHGDDDTYLYENVDDVPKIWGDYTVRYVTKDFDGVLTIELAKHY